MDALLSPPDFDLDVPFDGFEDDQPPYWETVDAVRAGRGEVRLARFVSDGQVRMFSLTFFTPRFEGGMGPQFSHTCRVICDLTVASHLADVLEVAVDEYVGALSPVQHEDREGYVGLVAEERDRGIEVTRWDGRRRPMVSATMVVGKRAVRGYEGARRSVACVVFPPASARPLAALLRSAACDL